MINYPLAPSVTMDEIVRHNRMALAWLWRNAEDLGFDRDRIHASGHSAGGHLVMMLLATDWPTFGDGLPADLLKSGTPISGLYDLEPIQLCYLNEHLRMDAEAARRNTPLAQTYPVSAPALMHALDSWSPPVISLAAGRALRVNNKIPQKKREGCRFDR